MNKLSKSKYNIFIILSNESRIMQVFLFHSLMNLIDSNALFHWLLAHAQKFLHSLIHSWDFGSKSPQNAVFGSQHSKQQFFWSQCAKQQIQQIAKWKWRNLRFGGCQNQVLGMSSLWGCVNSKESSVESGETKQFIKCQKWQNQVLFLIL